MTSNSVYGCRVRSLQCSLSHISYWIEPQVHQSQFCLSWWPATLRHRVSGTDLSYYLLHDPFNQDARDETCNLLHIKQNILPVSYGPLTKHLFSGRPLTLWVYFILYFVLLSKRPMTSFCAFYFAFIDLFQHGFCKGKTYFANLLEFPWKRSWKEIVESSLKNVSSLYCSNEKGKFNVRNS